MTSAHRIESIAVGKNELKLSSHPTFFIVKEDWCSVMNELLH